MSTPPAGWCSFGPASAGEGFYVPAMAATGRLEVTTRCVPT